MTINENGKGTVKKATDTKAEKIKEIKIIGATTGINNDGKTYYVATDNENYYLFIGKACDDPNRYLETNYDGLWDDIPLY